jgi:hypothetical protein
MNALITFLTLMVLLFAGLGQTHSIRPTTAFSIAGGLAAITMVLIVIRYRARKSGTG